MPYSNIFTEIKREIWYTELFWKLRVTAVPFRNQSHVWHGLLIIGGIGLWIGTYVAYMHWAELIHLAGKPGVDGMAARRDSAVVANFVMLAYFTIGVFRGTGGLAHNFFYYPLLINQFMPGRVYTLGETPPEYIIVAEGLSQDPLHFFKYAGPPALAFAAGAGITLLLGIGIVACFENVQEQYFWWMTRHIPPIYYRIPDTELTDELDDEYARSIFREAGVLEEFEAEAEKGRKIREKWETE